MNLKNKKVIITGATGGIGNSLVKKFTDNGSIVLATGTKEEKLNNLKNKFSNIYIEKFNLAEHKNIESFIEDASNKLGGIDVLVNNAALGGFIHAFEKFPTDEWDQMMNANVRGPFLLVKEALGLLTTAANSDAHASVVNIVSVDGIRVAMDNDWAYGAGKAALIQLTRQWAATQGNNHGKEDGRNITFNAIAPGPFPGMLDHYLETEEGRAAVGAVTVSGRVGDPVDIGAACVYLSSRAGSYVTGSTIPVDGGLLVGRRANS